jgi:hypothetical protein
MQFDRLDTTVGRFETDLNTHLSVINKDLTFSRALLVGKFSQPRDARLAVV